MTHDEMLKALMVERYGTGGVLARPASPQPGERRKRANPQRPSTDWRDLPPAYPQDSGAVSTGVLTEPCRSHEQSQIMERAGGRATNTTTGSDHSPDIAGKG